MAALGQKLKAQGTSNGGCLYEANPNAIAETIGFSALISDQCVFVLVVAKIFIADCSCRNEAIGAGMIELDE